MSDTGRILIADDEETVLRTTAVLLGEEGFDCDKAHNAVEALELLGKNSYDLLIADWKMPGNTKLEMLSELRSTGHDLPVIVVTGYPQFSAAAQNAEIGVFAEVVKPFDFDDFLSVVRKGVAEGQSRHAGK